MATQKPSMPRYVLEPRRQPGLPPTPRRMAEEMNWRFDTLEDDVEACVHAMPARKIWSIGVLMLRTMSQLKVDVEAFREHCWASEATLGCKWDWPEDMDWSTFRGFGQGEDMLEVRADCAEEEEEEEEEEMPKWWSNETSPTTMSLTTTSLTTTSPTTTSPTTSSTTNSTDTTVRTPSTSSPSSNAGVPCARNTQGAARFAPTRSASPEDSESLMERMAAMKIACQNKARISC